MDEVEVVVEALRSEATTWDENGAVIASVAVAVDSLRMTRAQAGIFQVLVDAYNDAVDQVHGRCSEGAQRLPEVATALRANADAYERRELEVTASFADGY